MAAVAPVIRAAAPMGRVVGEAAVAPMLEAAQEAGRRAGEAALDIAFKSGERESLAPQGPPFDEALLPPPSGRFIGRVDDRPWLVERLRAGGTTSITALGGMGGIGKTALAAVAIRDARAAGHFRDGIAVVLCQGKADPVEVLRLALTRFHPDRHEPKATDVAGLADAARELLKGKDALIVFDNVEPALSDRLAELVNPLSAGDATILFTARQRLPASVVPRDASRELDLLSDAEALDLFAQAYGTGDAAMLSATDRAAAVRCVKALANHTLAVKLAGAYAGDVGRPLDALAGELELRPLAVQGDTGERAVAAIFRQSTDQLPEHARRLFAALAAFPTLEFGREAALAVAASLNLRPPDGSNPVDLLVRRALLDADVDERMPPASDRERLRLHPLLGAFADEQLSSWPDEECNAAYLAVAAHYAAYANATADAALAPDEINITGALEWAGDHGEDELVVAICTGMQIYWRARGRTKDSLAYLPGGIATSGRLAAASGDRDDWLRAARLYLSYATALLTSGKINDATEYVKQSLAIRREVGDTRGEGVALGLLGDILQQRGDLAGAQTNYEQARRIMGEVGDTRGEGVALSKLGDILERRGDLAGAQTNYEQARRIMREVDDTCEEGIVLSKLGQIALERGRLDEAAELFAQSLVIRRTVQDRRGEGVDLAYLGMLADARDDVDAAETYYRDCLALMRDVQDAANEASIALILGQFLIERRGKRDEGCAMLRDAIAIYHAMGVPDEAEAREVARTLGCEVG